MAASSIASSAVTVSRSIAPARSLVLMSSRSAGDAGQRQHFGQRLQRKPHDSVSASLPQPCAQVVRDIGTLPLPAKEWPVASFSEGLECVFEIVPRTPRYSRNARCDAQPRRQTRREVYAQETLSEALTSASDQYRLQSGWYWPGSTARPAG